MFQYRVIGLFLSLATSLSLLSGCGNKLEKPLLPGPAPLSVDRILLRSKLTAADLRQLFSVLNEKGDFNSLLPWIQNLSDSQVEAWASFLNRWVYEDAQTNQGLIHLLNERIKKKGFQKWTTQWVSLLKTYPSLDLAFSDLLSDDSLYAVLKRDIQILDPVFLTKVLPQLIQSETNYVAKNSEIKINKPALAQDLKTILTNPESRSILSEMGIMALNSDVVPAVMKAAVDLRKRFGVEAFSRLALQMSELSKLRANSDETGKTSHLAEALDLVELMNRPSKPIVSALQEGLRTNPDLVQTLSLKWDPIFVSALSEIVLKVLLNPEDGEALDKNFWLSLPRENANSDPNLQFHRLYAIIFSGLQKITDPRRAESLSDSGSYRLPLQLNALLLTEWLETVARSQRSQLEKLSENEFRDKLWSLPLSDRDFKFSLTASDDKKTISGLVKKDLMSLGLTTVVSRLEHLLTQPDFGKTDYQVEFSEPINLRKAFSEVLASANSVRPFSDVSPFLVATIYHFTQSGSDSLLSLESLKTIPNMLSSVHGILSSLRPEDWKTFKHFLFQELKLGQLEPEDRRLIVGLFQSDPEAAEWVNQVLSKLSIIELVDQGEKGKPTLFDLYHAVLRNLNKQQIDGFGEAISRFTVLGLLKVNDSAESVYPGIVSILQNGDGLVQFIASLSELSDAQQNYLSVLFRNVLGANLENQYGFELHLKWISSFFEKSKLDAAKSLLDWVGTTGWNVIPPEEALTEPERKWLIQFNDQGGVESLQSLLSSSANPPPVRELVEEVLKLSDRRVLDEGLRLLGKIENERMKEISMVLINLDRSGELKSILNLINLILKQGEAK